MKILKIAIVLSLASLSFASNSEMLSIDYKTEGDNKVTLDSETGIEWLDLTVTNRLSINTLRSMLHNELVGWRFPTVDEVTTFFKNSLPSQELTGSPLNQMIRDDGPELNKLGQYLGYNHIYNGRETTYGLYINDNNNDFNGTEVLMAGVRTDENISHRLYLNSNTSLNKDSIHSNYGVFLVSDGGYSISSIKNPELNANNPNSPANVPLSASFTLLSIGILFSLRRKKLYS